MFRFAALLRLRAQFVPASAAALACVLAGMFALSLASARAADAQEVPEASAPPAPTPLADTPAPPAQPPAAQPPAPDTNAVPASLAAPAALAPAQAATPTTDAGTTTTLPVATAQAAATDKKAWPWRGIIAFRNLTSTTLFVPDYEQTYAPYEGLGLMIAPRYMLNDTMSIGLWQYSTVELTNTGNTTYYREPQLSDTMVSFGWTVLNTAAGILKVEKTERPPTGFSLTLQGIVGLPTSKASQAKQLYMAPGIGLSGRFSWRDLTVSLTSRFQHSFYKSTEGQFNAQPITTCTGDAFGCDPSLQTTGVRSAQNRILAIGSLSYSFTEKLSASISGGEIMDWLPSLAATTISVTGGAPVQLTPGDDQNFRAIMYWGAGIDYAVFAWLGAGIGLETYNAQLKLDSTYETPGINRYTTAYLELSLALDGLPH